MEKSNFNLINKFVSSLDNNPVLYEDNINTLVFKHKDFDLIKTAGFTDFLKNQANNANKYIRDKTLNFLTGGQVNSTTLKNLQELDKWIKENGGVETLQTMVSDYKKLKPKFDNGMGLYNTVKPYLPYMGAFGLGALGGGLFGGGGGALMGGLGTMALMYLFRNYLSQQNKTQQSNVVPQNKAQQANAVPQGKEFTGKNVVTKDNKGNPTGFTEDYLKHRYANPGSDKYMKQYNIGANNFDGKSYKQAIYETSSSNLNRWNEASKKYWILDDLNRYDPNSKKYKDANTFFKKRTGKDWSSLDDQTKQKYLQRAKLVNNRSKAEFDKSEKLYNKIW